MPMFEDDESESREIKAEALGEAATASQPRGFGRQDQLSFFTHTTA